MRFQDMPVILAAVITLMFYVYASKTYHRFRAKSWSMGRTVMFFCGVISGVFAIMPPMDDFADTWFSVHMLQHLILTDVTAPLLLLGGPLLLMLGGSSPVVGRKIIGILQSKTIGVLTFPVVTWMLFIVTIWIIHFSPFFEAALEHESLHWLEHAIYILTACLFWLPVINVGPQSWGVGGLTYPLRMLYLIIAMPAEGFLGFSIYGARHVLYGYYRAGGVADQQLAGELMWIGSGLIMFIAFLLVGFEWLQHEERMALRHDRLVNR